jgi:hypothetical protein
MAGFEPAASCSQSRRANQAAPHPVEPIRSLPSHGPGSMALQGLPGDTGRDSRIRRCVPKLSSQRQWSSRPWAPACPGSLRRLGVGVPNRYAVRAHLVPRHSSHRTRGRSSMAEPQPSKLVMRVRFPSPAPTRNPRSARALALWRIAIKRRGPSVVPAACPIGPWPDPSAGPWRTAPPSPWRSPRRAPWWRAGRSEQHGCWSDPSAPSARAG